MDIYIYVHAWALMNEVFWSALRDVISAYEEFIGRRDTLDSCYNLWRLAEEFLSPIERKNFYRVSHGQIWDFGNFWVHDPYVMDRESFRTRRYIYENRTDKKRKIIVVEIWQQASSSTSFKWLYRISQFYSARRESHLKSYSHRSLRVFKEYD